MRTLTALVGLIAVAGTISFGTDRILATAQNAPVEVIVTSANDRDNSIPFPTFVPVEEHADEQEAEEPGDPSATVEKEVAPETVEYTEAPAHSDTSADTPVSQPQQQEPVSPPPQSPEPNADENSSENAATHIEIPYATQPIPTEKLNTSARSALVNIFCKTSATTLNPMSGSGVIVDPRGIILTNAHVAQYVLLAESDIVNLSCTARTGTPAQNAWNIRVAYMPRAWVLEHAADIKVDRPEGTGENDFAFLIITGSTDGAPLPPQFPFLPVDTREGLFAIGDSVLVASYPAGFLGGVTTTQNLHPASVITQIAKLYTFQDNTVDLVSLGGIILAQSGSSGGAVVNEWGRLVALIATAEDAATTGERDLRAITLAHIDRALQQHSGSSFVEFMSRGKEQIFRQFENGGQTEILQLLVNALQ
jgi:S1-C subfamily serine protease